MYFQLSEILKRHAKKPLNTFELQTEPIDAAVAVLFHQKNKEHSIILTKRSEEVEHHKGQICFPGGVHDSQDKTLWETALRETHEEIGIDRERISYIGELGKILTPSGFRVTPFVAQVAPPFTLSPSPIEIAEVIEVPLSYLTDPKHFQFVDRTYNNTIYKDPLFTYQNHQIWGATGRILVELLEVCSLLQKTV